MRCKNKTKKRIPKPKDHPEIPSLLKKKLVPQIVDMKREESDDGAVDMSNSNDPQECHPHFFQEIY
jgi:hypothetical protein